MIIMRQKSMSNFFIANLLSRDLLSGSVHRAVACVNENDQKDKTGRAPVFESLHVSIESTKDIIKFGHRFKALLDSYTTVDTKFSQLHVPGSHTK